MKYRAVIYSCDVCKTYSPVAAEGGKMPVGWTRVMKERESSGHYGITGIEEVHLCRDCSPKKTS